MNKQPPRIAQFTAIKGRKIPNWPYKAGENFSTTISTNCTIPAMMAINMMNRKKDKSIVDMPAEIQISAPSFKTNSFKIQLKGTVTPNTNTTAAPRPTAVLTFLETARKEHIPKK